MGFACGKVHVYFFRRAEIILRMTLLKKIWKFVRWPLAALVLVYVIAVIANIPWPLSKARSDAAVAAIRAQRLTMKDGDSSNVPIAKPL